MLDAKIDEKKANKANAATAVDAKEGKNSYAAAVGNKIEESFVGDTSKAA